MEIKETMEIVTQEALLRAPAVDYHALDPEFVGCPCCGCCDCCGCDCCSLPDCCRSCPTCCGCCPNCCPSCCPPSCACCCRWCCCLPRLLLHLPKMPSCPVHIKRLLIIVVIVVLIVVIIVGALLMGLYITQVLQMTIEGLEGGDSQLNLSVNMEEAATFYVKDQTNDLATVIYDFSKLLIGYKPWPGQACYVTRMDKGNIQGLDTILKGFQTALREKEAFLTTLVDRSILGTTFNILCSHVPVFQT
ncbi:pulmonary surfactant-associated protein C-like isoform X2 [Zootoca vivipara]|uniref:pulmonary surfactant-associated protein C-like isoform X2 n=1 Tax=Zootoca vivipara TaxID=8524 RepID=UPI001590BD20|nr:pulmonary surfactant-associated protein C-like isoform X2 [Zootoca vivipara]